MSKPWILIFNNRDAYVYDTEELLLEQLHISLIQMCDSILQDTSNVFTEFVTYDPYGDEYSDKRHFSYWKCFDKNYFSSLKDEIDDDIGIDDIADLDLLVYSLIPEVKTLYQKQIENKFVQFFSDINLNQINNIIFQSKDLYVKHFIDGLQKIKDGVLKKLNSGNLAVNNRPLFDIICEKEGVKFIKQYYSAGYFYREAAVTINESIKINLI